MSKPKVVIFASGTKTGGGSGAMRLIEESQSSDGVLNAEISWDGENLVSLKYPDGYPWQPKISACLRS